MGSDQKCKHGKALDNPCVECDENPKEYRAVGSDRIAEIARRTAHHCRQARREIEYIGRGKEINIEYAKRITSNLQAEIARDAALLCAEEVISCFKSEVRGVPEAQVSGSPSSIRKSGEASDVAAGIPASQSQGSRLHPSEHGQGQG